MNGRGTPVRVQMGLTPLQIQSIQLLLRFVEAQRAAGVFGSSWRSYHTASLETLEWFLSSLNSSKTETEDEGEGEGMDGVTVDEDNYDDANNL